MTSPAFREQKNIIDELRHANREQAHTLDENARLQSSRFYLASIIEFSNDAIISINLDGIVVSWNRTAERLFGYSAGEIIGRPNALLVPADRRQEERDMLARLKRGEIIAHYETWRLRKDGGLLLVSLAASPIRDAAGTILGASKILHDITEEKRAQEEVKTLQAEMVHLSRWNMMGTMASSLAHEINQPLTATMNYILAAQNVLGSTANPKAGAFLDKAVTEIAHAGSIIRSLRAFIDKREVSRKTEDLNTVLEDALALSLSVATAAKTKIRKRLAPDLPPVLMDRIQIQQVLINLVRNAAEAMADRPEGQIVIETKRGEQGFVIVSVSDTGPGLPPEILKQPFQPFVTTKQRGMGVGLSICRAIVEAHGGRIRAQANTPHGVMFQFTLPLTDAAP